MIVTGSGKELRLSQFVNPSDGRSLLVDTSAASSLGPIKGLEKLKLTLGWLKPLVDGIILNPGQLEKSGVELAGKENATLLCRGDWTNALRDKDYIMPVKKISHFKITNVKDVMNLGAMGIVGYFLLGYSEDFEAMNFSNISSFSSQCNEWNIPFVVEILPIGPMITEHNYSQSIRMGASFMVEVGADVIVIPNPGEDIFKEIKIFCPVPLLVKFNEKSTVEAQLINNCKKVLSWGGNGIVLGENLLGLDKIPQIVKELKNAIHNVHNVELRVRD